MQYQLPQETIFYLLEKAMKLYRKLAQSKINDAGYDISINQLILLVNLKERPKSSQVELAEYVFKDFASVARMVDLLVKKNYLKRTECKIDRRKKDLTLTPKCISMLEKLMPLMNDYREIALSGLTKDATLKTQAYLKHLIKNCKP